MIVLRHVWMRYPQPESPWHFLRHPFSKTQTYAALQDLSLNVERGDRIAVLGPNGAGKTTMLKLIGGLLLPTMGEVMVGGRDTVRHNTAARKSVGLVMNEERSFYWRLTGRQNLDFYAALDNLFGRERRRRIDELLRLVGLGEAADWPVSNYSSGMKQRLSIARGLLIDPDVLIMDEPTRTLDPIACEELIDFILQQLHQRIGKTLLIATHRLEEAVKLCNRVVVIAHGRLMAQDLLADLAAQGVNLADYYRRAIHESEIPVDAEKIRSVHQA